MTTFPDKPEVFQDNGEEVKTFLGTGECTEAL